jgi:acyl carrier protein
MNTAITGKEGLDLTIRKIISEKLGLDQSLLKDSAHFKDDLGVDSLDMLELQLELEKEFHISITDEEAEKLTTVGSLVNYLKEKK